MTEHDGSPLADAEQALRRRLPARAQVIARRLHRFDAAGWDINGLVLVRDEAQDLARGSAALGIAEAEAPSQRIASLAAELVSREQLPDTMQGSELARLGQSVVDALPEPEPVEPEFQAVELIYEDAPSTPAPEASAAPVRADTADSTRDAWGDDSSALEAAPTPPRATAPAPIAPRRTGSHVAVAPGEPALPSDFRIYHLSDCGPLSLQLSQRFEAMGLDIELLEQVEELVELLGAVPADLVLVDASFSDDLESIGTAVRLARARNTSHRLRLAAMTDADDISLRLSARRAGVDALLVAPTDANEVLQRLQSLADPQREDSFRILIVEDDRSQALFAEGILRNAGMDSLVVIDALDVMPALKNFRPDLILMDLNMPGANGIELTALIREQDAHAHTPIVFLSGEASEDLQFDAIDAGGDDFLSKPIRPRHLISAVQTRVRRYRQQESRRVRRPDKDAATGLVYRKTLLELLDGALQRGEQRGGLVFLEVESLALLRERIGLTALEILLGDASRLLTQAAGDLPATRFGDGSWLVLDREREELALDSLATELRQVLMQHAFTALGHPLRLRLSAGVCAFRHGFVDSGVMINAVEKVAREARTHERGVRRFEPPRANEAVREAALLEQVREAIDSDSLVLLHQPVVAVAGGDVSQYQVLLRLRDASGKLRPAAEIIPMAERSSLIVEIDRWVMQQALALIAESSQDHQPLRLFVSQSPLTLAAPGHAEWLGAELAGSGVAGDCVVVELRLEDAAVHAATVSQFCSAMAPSGLRFCLSQFEAGAEAAALLDRLPLSFIKLARKYTTGSLSPVLRAELKDLIDQAHRRQLQVIGHCVEDAQSAATLWMSGIDFIQGNLVQQADADMNFDFHQAVL